jgi:hypothetical protein
VLVPAGGPPFVAEALKVEEAVVVVLVTGFFDTIWSEYVGYGPGPLKSFLTMASKLTRIVLSTVSSHSRYEHISRSIWLISRRVNMPCATIDQDLFE